MTDGVDGAERDPLDLELGLENLVRMASQYDDEEADARAARFAGALERTFNEARRIALGDGKLRHRAAAVNALEGCARSFALRLWAPLLATRPAGEPIEEPDLSETWATLARAPAEILDLVRERRQHDGVDPKADVPLEVLAIRLGGYALDACGEDADLGHGRGPTAHDTCLWLRKLEGLADGSRELPDALKNALSALFWAPGRHHEGHGARRGRRHPMARAVRGVVGARHRPSRDAAAAGDRAADDGRRGARAVLRAGGGAPDGGVVGCAGRIVGSDAAEASRGPSRRRHGARARPLEALLPRCRPSPSRLAHPRANLEAMCTEPVLAGDRLQMALADPVKALHPPVIEITEDDGTLPASSAVENAPRVAGLVARAIRARELSMLDVWFASLGPVGSALLEAAVKGAIRRTPPPPPVPKKAEPKRIEGYELVKALGEGGIGSVWLVRKPGADRLFVLKIPKADALANATEVEREGILASFVEEAKALAGLYHPNVANIIDRGVSGGVPFLVLEYLIGADLKQYATARAMSLFELRQVVVESCAGLAALHSAGLVHRDVKPANLWLRLPLGGREKFEPTKHRDPAMATPLATVVIDFGMVRAIRVKPPRWGALRRRDGVGYIAPEQVLDPVELDPRSDVYALAGTIYNVTTGRTFFDEIEATRDRIIAHMRRDPFDDAERLRPYPAAVAKLLRAATVREPKDRPHPMEFGREFVAAASEVASRRALGGRGRGHRHGHALPAVAGSCSTPTPPPDAADAHVDSDSDVPLRR